MQCFQCFQDDLHPRIEYILALQVFVAALRPIMASRVLQAVKRPGLLAAAEAIHAGAACSFGNILSQKHLEDAGLTPGAGEMALLTLRAAVDWALASPPELSSSQVAEGHPMTRACSAAAVLSAAAQQPLRTLPSATAVCEAACELAAWLAAAPTQHPPRVQAPYPPAHGFAMSEALQGMIQAFVKLQEAQQWLAPDTAARMLAVVPALLQRMLDKPEDAAGWARLALVLADHGTRPALHYALPAAVKQCHEALMELCRSMVAKIASRQPGSQSAALIACLPCFVAAVANSTAIHGKMQTPHSHAISSAGVSVLLDAYHCCKMLLTTSRKRFLETLCPALQHRSYATIDQDTRSQPRDVRSRLRQATAFAVKGLGLGMSWLPVEDSSAEICATAMDGFGRYTAAGSVCDALMEALGMPLAAMVDVIPRTSCSRQGKLPIHEAAHVACEELGRLALQPVLAAGTGMQPADADCETSVKAAAVVCHFLCRQIASADYQVDCPNDCDCGLQHADWAISALAGLALRLPCAQLDLVVQHGMLETLMGTAVAVSSAKPRPPADAAQIYSTTCVALHALAWKHPPSRRRMAAPSGSGSWPAMLATLQRALPQSVRQQLAPTFVMVSEAVGHSATATAAAAAPAVADPVASPDAAMAQLLKV